MNKMDDDDINVVLEYIGAYTVGAIVLFMIACTVIQVSSWIKGSDTTCEVTVQKE